MATFAKQYGTWGVITGAARGLGQAFAQDCASRGLNVILIDILEAELKQTALDISSTFSVETKTIHADLGDPLQIKRVLQECDSHAIGLFCCNHAATHLNTDGKLKAWLDTPLSELHKMLEINVSSSITLLFHFAQKMRYCSRGGIVLVSSGACLTGAPYLGQYTATKAFLTNLGETLHWELKQCGVDVTTVMTGLTKTPGMLKFINSQGLQKMPMLTARTVASTTLDNLGKKPIVIPGWRNQLQSFITTRLLPRKWSTSLMGKMLPQFFHILPFSKEKLCSSSVDEANQKF